MVSAHRLLQLLQRAGQSLQATDPAVRACGLWSVALVGSLSRGDFRPGGSDVDLLVVHQCGDLPPAEVGRHPDVRVVVRHFGEPVVEACGGSGDHRPVVVDCHFVDLGVLRDQPRWAAPRQFLSVHTRHDRFLWIYGFDFVQHALVLWGESPTALVQAHDPLPYIPVAARDLSRRIADLSSATQEGGPLLELVDRWKAAAGELMTLLALAHGCRSLRKQDLHRAFNTQVPYFPGKDFAASLWAEYLYGTVFQERQEWIARCARFCDSGLTLLT